MNYYIDAIEAWKASKTKPRGEWKLGELSNEQLAEVLRQLLNRKSHAEVREFIQQKFKLAISSDRSLSEFFSGVKHFLGAARRRATLAGVKLTGSLSPEERAQIDQQNLQLVTTVAQEKLDNPESTMEELTFATRAVLDILKHATTQQDLSIKLRRLELLESQVAQAKKTASSSQLTDAQKAQRIREIFKK